MMQIKFYFINKTEDNKIEGKKIRAFTKTDRISYMLNEMFTNKTR